MFGFLFQFNKVLSQIGKTVQRAFTSCTTLIQWLSILSSVSFFLSLSIEMNQLFLIWALTIDLKNSLRSAVSSSNWVWYLPSTFRASSCAFSVSFLALRTSISWRLAWCWSCFLVFLAAFAVWIIFCISVRSSLVNWRQSISDCNQKSVKMVKRLLKALAISWAQK